MKPNITLDRNKIEIIGRKGVKVAQINKQGKELAVWDITKTIRRKNILFCYEGFTGDRLKLTFKTIKHAIKCKHQFEESKDNG